MMVPWLFLYSLLIPTLIILSVVNVIISNDYIISIILILQSPIFSYLWLSLYSYRYSVLRNDSKTCDAGNNSLPYQYIPVLQNEFVVEENKWRIYERFCICFMKVKLWNKDRVFVWL